VKEIVSKLMGLEKRKPPVSVLFVCMGNICRSPIAEGVFRRRVEEAGLTRLIAIDSAGTHGYHLGAKPDPRAQAAAARRLYDLSTQRARQITPQDMETFDYVLAMDLNNLAYLDSLSPPDQRHKARLLLEYASGVDLREVPDPYYGPEAGFELVLDLAENASRGLLSDIQLRLRVSHFDGG
jgi:low molecular weight protein-tyrosine phosphatase